MAERTFVQFRVGVRFLRRIDQAVREDETDRTAWIADAANTLLRDNAPSPTLITASELLAQKKWVAVRIPTEVFKEINAQCREREYPRTLWLMDACINKLSRRPPVQRLIRRVVKRRRKSNGKPSN